MILKRSGHIDNWKESNEVWRYAKITKGIYVNPHMLIVPGQDFPMSSTSSFEVKLIVIDTACSGSIIIIVLKTIPTTDRQTDRVTYTKKKTLEKKKKHAK